MRESSKQGANTPESTLSGTQPQASASSKSEPSVLSEDASAQVPELDSELEYELFGSDSCTTPQPEDEPVATPELRVEVSSETPSVIANNPQPGNTASTATPSPALQRTDLHFCAYTHRHPPHRLESARSNR